MPSGAASENTSRLLGNDSAPQPSTPCLGMSAHKVLMTVRLFDAGLWPAITVFYSATNERAAPAGLYLGQSAQPIGRVTFATTTLR